MNTRIKMIAGSVALVCAGTISSAVADDLTSVLNELSALQLKVEKLENDSMIFKGITEGEASQVADRSALDDKQEAAVRLDNLTIDPEYRGFIRIPNTDVIMKFNAKPHVDLTSDSGYAGDKYRFVTAKIPVTGEAMKGGGEQFNINANASQFRWDVRTLNVPGNPRFYYQNDFFGDGNADMKFRLQHLYGAIYNVVVGFTYGVFEDPDIWPDTVDYEGPNAVNFARRPLVHYKQRINDNWNATFGIEKPDYYVDTTGAVTVVGLDSPMPDIGANLRWENSDAGHMQLSGIVRSIGVRDSTAGDDSVLGVGVNLGGTYKITDSDTLLGLVNIGEGIGGMGNDSSFENTDAAFDANGNLEALPYYSGMLGMSHIWNAQWRSTVSYGYVNVDNASAQAGDAYHETTYVSANVICQVRRQMSIGLEGLYGAKETKDGSDGDVFRLQLGLVYSIF